MRALFRAGACVATTALVLTACSHHETRPAPRRTVAEPGAGGPGGRERSGEALGPIGPGTEKVGHLEGTIEKVEPERMLLGVRSSERPDLLFVDVTGAEVYDLSGERYDTKGREALFGRGGELTKGQRVVCEYTDVEKVEGPEGGEPRLVYRARRVDVQSMTTSPGRED